MKNLSFALIAIAVLAVTFTNCKKKTTTPTNTCVAGKDGTIAIVTYAIHNGDTLLNYEIHPDTAFVKFNATTSPGTSPGNYDTYFESEAGEDHVHCSKLRCGDYFIYRTAYDSVANKVYHGTAAVSLSSTDIEKDIFITVN
jgi:hypothetical protein